MQLGHETQEKVCCTKGGTESSVAKGPAQTKNQTCSEIVRLFFLTRDLRVFSGWALCETLLRKTEAEQRKDFYAKQRNLDYTLGASTFFNFPGAAQIRHTFYIAT